MTRTWDSGSMAGQPVWKNGQINVGGGSILGSFQAAQQEATRANLERYKQGMAIYDEIISRYKKGGGFVKGAEATLERTKTRDVAAGMQSLVSSGLAGTTMAAGIGKKWEEEVGSPARLSIADIAGQRISQAQMGKAGFIERREDTGPDPGLVSQLMQGIGQTPMQQRAPTSQQSPGLFGRPKSATTLAEEAATRQFHAARTASFAQPTAKRATTTPYKAPAGVQVGSSYYGAAYKPTSTIQSAYQKLATQMGGKATAAGYESVKRAGERLGYSY